VSAAALFLLFGLVTCRWWWHVGRTLLADLRTAGSPAPRVARPLASAPRLAPAVLATSRVPLNRLLAFQGVPHRIANRRCWEAGFGRRGL
jgi:hypothetical protein